MNKLQLVKINSKWSGSTREQVFVVSNILEKNESIWVEYYNRNTKQTYNCLLEAFTLRFNEIINEN